MAHEWRVNNASVAVLSTNLGIGTAPPQALLHVKGFARFKVPYYSARQYNYSAYRVGRMGYTFQPVTNVLSWYYFNSGESYFKPEIPGVYYVAVNNISNGAGNSHIEVINVNSGAVSYSHDDTHHNTSGPWESKSFHALCAVNGTTDGIIVRKTKVPCHRCLLYTI